jgi:hypothetical protein
MSAAINYRRTFQGAWTCSATVNGYLVERQFMGYTKQEAAQLFRQVIKELQA